MVAKVITGKNISGVLNYNENKVKEGNATCIYAHNFFSDASTLSFYNKLNLFKEYSTKNQNVKTNAIHISLNFDPKEKIDKATLSRIAISYLDKIGFGNQPSLIYQHYDASHPHVHIVTTNVQIDGKRIDLHNIGRIKSEKARREVEQQFDLVKADRKKEQLAQIIPPLKPERLIYGKSETKRSITNVVRFVTRSYKYTSIPELNAILHQFNVTADRGNEGSIMNQKKGLIYSIIDDQGKKVGVPIKASSIYGKPTLANLEKQFKLNEALRVPLKKRVQDKIDQTFSNSANSKLIDFVKALEKNKVKVVFRQNDEGRVYGITFVDNHNRVVFNGSDLGKQYSAKAIMERLTEIPKTGLINLTIAKTIISDFKNDSMYTKAPSSLGIEQVVKDLTMADLNNQNVDPALTRRRRKKRRRRSI